MFKMYFLLHQIDRRVQLLRKIYCATLYTNHVSVSIMHNKTINVARVLRFHFTA